MTRPSAQDPAGPRPGRPGAEITDAGRRLEQDSCGVRVRDGCLLLLVVIGLTTDSADTVGYCLNECLNTLIWVIFSHLAIIQ
jgi:hypothetical protein